MKNSCHQHRYYKPSHGSPFDRRVSRRSFAAFEFVSDEIGFHEGEFAGVPSGLKYFGKLQCMHFWANGLRNKNVLKNGCPQRGHLKEAKRTDVTMNASIQAAPKR
jgi:hypothetical protein